MAEESEKVAEAPKKSKMGLIIGIIIALVTLVGGSVAGAVLGPRLLGGQDNSHEPPAKAGKAAEGGHEAPATPEKIVSVDIPPLVVDIRDAEGRIHHLKVGLAAELGDGITVEDFKLYTPRGREACLSYLRSLSLEDVSDPARYASIKDEISKRVTEAVGAERIHRILLIDFVLQ
jgi:flagellar basal body-associated protein FliL